MKITMINLDKKRLKQINNDTKYILITNSYDKVSDYLNLSIKPILILYGGSYVVDLENNSVIINKSIDVSSLNKIIKYSNGHNVDIKYYKYNETVYGIKLVCDNYHRRLIIPYMFKDLYPKVSCYTINKEIFIYDKKVSMINAIGDTLNYLNIKNNCIDLENIYINVSNDGYYKDNSNWKGYVLYEI